PVIDGERRLPSRRPLLATESERCPHARRTWMALKTVDLGPLPGDAPRDQTAPGRDWRQTVVTVALFAALVQAIGMGIDAWRHLHQGMNPPDEGPFAFSNPGHGLL